MRLIDADAFDRDLCNHKFTAALNEAADAGTAFEDKEMYYSTQSFRDVMKYRPTIEAVPLDKLCEWLETDCILSCVSCEHLFGGQWCKQHPELPYRCHRKEHWKDALTKWMEEQDGTD